MALGSDVKESIPFHDLIHAPVRTRPGHATRASSGPCCHPAGACPHHPFERGFPLCDRCKPVRARPFRGSVKGMVPWTEEQPRKVKSMKNTVTLVGFVGNNPEVRTTQSGASITTVSLATTNSFKDSEGNRQTETEWHRITCFNGIGKCVA